MWGRAGVQKLQSLFPSPSFSSSFSSSSLLLPSIPSSSSFLHYETRYPTVTTLKEAFTGPPISNSTRRPVFQTMNLSGNCLLQSSGSDHRDASILGMADVAPLHSDNMDYMDYKEYKDYKCINSGQMYTILRRILNSMIRLRAFDETFKAAQRQGKLSFFLESRGEEAAVVATAAALEDDDDIFSQYREHGALLWRGASFKTLANQCCGSAEDLAKGRQMPVHYGDRARNFHTVSSPLATQLLHAVGFAYAKKLAGGEGAYVDPGNDNKSISSSDLSKAQSIVACYFGDGTASEGDFHAALNFAATLRCPVVFICRNNGYAISTPIKEQYAGDGIVSRAEGYGMSSCRIDGGDARAVYLAMRAARRQALATGRPILLELMTFRLGDHSTSDDRRNYVPKSLLVQGDQDGDPIGRLSQFLSTSDAELAAVRNAAILEARHAIHVAQHTTQPAVETMFDDVYDPVSASRSYELTRQRSELQRLTP